MSFLPWNHCEASLPETLVDQAMLPVSGTYCLPGGPMPPGEVGNPLFCPGASASTSEAPVVGVGVGHLVRTTSIGPGGPIHSPAGKSSRSACHPPSPGGGTIGCPTGRPGPPQTEAGKPACRRRHQAVEVARVPGAGRSGLPAPRPASSPPPPCHGAGTSGPTAPRPSVSGRRTHPPMCPIGPLECGPKDVCKAGAKETL